MTTTKALALLDLLPDAVDSLEIIAAAADELADIGYGGAGALAGELELALEGLKTGAPNALLYLEGVRNAKGARRRLSAGRRRGGTDQLA